MISEELLQSFVAEASDLLDDVEPSLIEYSRLEEEEERGEIVNRVFRHFHSIKGSAGFVGLHDIAKLTHEAETFLEQYRKAPDKIIPHEDITLLCRTVDLLRAIFENGGASQDEDGNDLGIDSLIQEIVASTKAVKERAAGAMTSARFGRADAPPPSPPPEPEAVPEAGSAGKGGPDTTRIVNPDAAGTADAPPPPDDAPPLKSDTTNVDIKPSSMTRRRSSDTARIINSNQMARQEKMNTAEFVARYVTEANELLEQIEQAILQAEQHPESSGEAVQEALRYLHSFKGNSGFMNLSDLERLSHRMESEVETNVGRTLGIDAQTFDVFLQMIDVLRQGVHDFSCGGSGNIPEADTYIALMDEYSKARPATNPRLAPTAPTAAAAESRNSRVYRKSDGEKKTDTAVLAQSKASSSSTDTRVAKQPDAPAPAPVTVTAPAPGGKITDTADLIRPPTAIIGRRRDAAPAEPEAGASPRKKGSTRLITRVEHDTTRLVLRGDTSAQEDLRGKPKADNIVINTAAPVSPSQDRLDRSPDTARKIKDIARQSKETSTTTADAPSRDSDTVRKATGKLSDTSQKRRMADQMATRNDIRVDLRKLDGMLDLVGELVIAEAMVTRHPVVWNADNESLERAVHQLRRVASSLQDMATSVRMIPLAQTFRRMTRLVYDLSVKAGKMVDLVLLGEETEVDRTVIERISDPLVHIIRNAIDHGIEPPEARAAAGKPETGRLTIEGHHEGGEVWIVITDDGRGLDREAILRRAIASGLVQGDGSDMTDSQIYHFIFEPGFSTAPKVTDISGRGFGMDVVRKNIEKLSGRIDIRTRPGEGTAVVMRIPLTLAIIDGMLVSSGETRYIIPLLSIRESLRPDPQQIVSTPDGQEMIKIRNDLIPIVKLDEIFERVKSRNSLMDGILMIIEGDDGEVVALFADELLGQQETVIKGLSGWLKKSRGVSGCTILGDGEVGLILDIGAIVRLARERSAAWL